MRYAPDEEGNFSGQTHRATYVLHRELPSWQLYYAGWAAGGHPVGRGSHGLDAGRKSLDERRAVDIVSEGDKWELK
jgi:D-galacturonate reductase